MSKRSKLRFKSRIPAILLFSSFFISFYSAFAQTRADSVSILVNEAYGILTTDTVKAIEMFEKAVGISPDDLLLHRQLGYIYEDQNQSAKALKHFEESERIQSSDTIRLQIAFILISIGRDDEAAQLLRGLRQSGDENIRNTADTQLAAITKPGAVPAEKRSDWYTRIYAAPYYDSRWETVFYDYESELGYYFDRRKLFFTYGFLSLAADGKSKLGEVPEIFSDNSLIGGIGVGIKPLAGLELKTQVGLAYDLVQQDSGMARWREDFRALAIYGNGIYPNFEFHDDLRITLQPLLDLYSSVGYYSRYKNAIGYLQGRVGTRVFEMSYTAADLYARSMFVKDSEKEFYNNMIDAAIGMRLLPFYKWNLYLMAEYYRGVYLGEDPLPQPASYTKYFGGFRFFIIYDQIF